jgi:general stress protein YciG
MAKKNPHAVALGRLGGLKGGRARADNLSPEELSEIGRKAGLQGGKARAAALSRKRRSEIAKKAAAARWKKAAETNT